MGARTIPWLALYTQLIRQGDDVPALVARYTRGIAEPGDLIVISESAVAIAQGRAVDPDSIEPGMLARLLSRLADKDASLGTPAAMELAIREAGAPRLLVAAMAAAVGRIARRRGLFYRVAGRRIALIDDIGGTLLPPFEAVAVLGPSNPAGVVRSIRQATRVDAAIADANDLGHADVLACTGPWSGGAVAALLVDNPFGNGDEQTPIVVFKLSRLGPAVRRRCPRWQAAPCRRPRLYSAPEAQ